MSDCWSKSCGEGAWVVSACWLGAAWSGACARFAATVWCVAFVAAETGSAAVAVGFVIMLNRVSASGCPGDVPWGSWSMCVSVLGEAGVRVWVVSLEVGGGVGTGGSWSSPSGGALYRGNVGSGWAVCWVAGGVWVGSCPCACWGSRGCCLGGGGLAGGGGYGIPCCCWSFL